ncbi:MAG: NADH-quinone oxidoreductase subunit J [Halieaceae bacterium]|jgi:NADH-quinone oxidoreductase subunit J
MIEVLFYSTALLALITTIVALSNSNATHALLYLVLSTLAIAVLFFLLGAPFAAALEVLIYAGAIMVLFVFVVMMLNIGDVGIERERQSLSPGTWVLPSLIAALLLAEMLFAIGAGEQLTPGHAVTPKAVGLSLFGPYVLAVEIASMLLISALVGAYHVARHFLARNEKGMS